MGKKFKYRGLFSQTRLDFSFILIHSMMCNDIMIIYAMKKIYSKITSMKHFKINNFIRNEIITAATEETR